MRMLTRLIVVVLVLGGLAFAADRVAAVLVARQVATAITTSQRLAQPASVTFGRVPFLTQAMRGRYDSVTASLESVPVRNNLTVDRIDATLQGVDAPTMPILRHELTQLTADQGEAIAFVSYPALDAALRQTIGTGPADVRLSRAAADRVMLNGRVNTPLGAFTLGGQIQVGVSRGVVTLRVLGSTLTGVPALLRGQVAPLLNVTALSPQLPFGFRVATVQVEETGLRLTASGTHLVLPARRA